MNPSTSMMPHGIFCFELDDNGAVIRCWGNDGKPRDRVPIIGELEKAGRYWWGRVDLEFECDTRMYRDLVHIQGHGYFQPDQARRTRARLEEDKLERAFFPNPKYQTRKERKRASSPDRLAARAKLLGILRDDTEGTES